MSDDVIEYEIPEDITKSHVAIALAVLLSNKRNKNVRFDFNGVSLEVNPSDCIAGVIDRYQKKLTLD